MNIKKKLKNEFNNQIQIGDPSNIKEQISFENKKKSFLSRGIFVKLSIFTASVAAVAVAIIFITRNKPSISGEFIDNNYNYSYGNNYKDNLSSLLNKDNYELNVLKTQKKQNVILNDSTKQDIISFGINIDEKEGFTDSYSIEETGYITYDIPFCSDNNNLIYPGSLIRVNTPNESSDLTTFGLKTGNITVSSSLYNNPSYKGPIAKAISDATKSKTDSVINEFVKGLSNSNIIGASKTKFSVCEIKNVSELRASLGTTNIDSSSDYKDFFDKTKTKINNYERQKGATNINSDGIVLEKIEQESSIVRSFTLIDFSQEFFSITVDSIYKPSEIISKSNSKKDVENCFSKDGLCAYVSSISYGRRAMFVFESNKSYQDLRISSLDNIANVSSSDSIVSSDSMVIGMNLKTANELSTAKSVSEIISTLKNEDLSASNFISSPISFKMRYIDGTNATVPYANITNHYLKTRTKDQ